MSEFGDKLNEALNAKNTRSCSHFESGTYLNENIWVGIYAKEN